eukprot:TRINITY_DN24410_c0_g1_i1.p1 TRINITY_DN24410_c0_g1~~TRINITY_DN24410_c0_g1_i1.p1  ORF type:complete len:149 (-),score=11.63 TRINITY_DN24410_c0_g1_i1:25-471(-)
MIRLCLFLFCMIQANLAQLAGLQNLLGGLSFALHGNYCGLNHGDGEYKKKPIDVVDAACMAHDKCYGARYLDCRCDADFIQELKNIKKEGKKLSDKTQSAADLMISWFESSACKCASEKGVKELAGKISFKQKLKCLLPEALRPKDEL